MMRLALVYILPFFSSVIFADEQKKPNPHQIIKSIFEREELGDKRCADFLDEVDKDKIKKKADFKQFEIYTLCAKENDALEKLAQDAQKKLAGPFVLVARAYEIAARYFTESMKKKAECFTLSDDKRRGCFERAGDIFAKGIEYRNIAFDIYDHCPKPAK